MTESDLIDTIFAPLAFGAAGSYGLRDDVAFVSASSHGFIVTQDQVIEGTHFLPDDPLDMIARRLVRRNLSDIIAKGGVPTAAFLSLAWPASRDRSGIVEFARGLGDDLDLLCGKCPLMGGDTSVTSGHLIASLTMMGRATAPNDQPVLRSGAQVGDIVAVTGVIGDSWLGLQARQGLSDAAQLTVCSQFSMAPSPPSVAIAPYIGRYAHASIDVSDGLIKDATHIAKASQVAMTLDLSCLPLSYEAANFSGFDSDIDRAIALAIGGDDYQPLITLSEVNFLAFKLACEAEGVSVTKIGYCHEGTGMTLSYGNQLVCMPSETGWQI